MLGASDKLSLDLRIDKALDLLGLTARWSSAIAWHNASRDHGEQKIATLRDLLRCTEAQLSRIEGIGDKSIAALRAALARHDLSIGMGAGNGDQHGGRV
jgi:hypothetical protein